MAAKHEKEPFINDSPKYSKPIPITEHHKIYHSLCKDRGKRIVLCNGAAGTGKSYTASYYGTQYLYSRDVDRIVLCRSLEGLGSNPGYYPGTAFEKNAPKLMQLMNYISSLCGCSISGMLQSEKLQIVGLHDLQGIDLPGAFLIVTEAQTLTPEEMYCIVTRGAEKIIIEGDNCAAQSVNHKIKLGEDGLKFLEDTIGDLPFVGKVEMDENDIVRKDYIKDIIIRMMPALANLRRR